MLRLLLVSAVCASFCSAGYNEISRYRPLKEDEKDFIDPDDLEYKKKHNITGFIASGYRQKDLSLDTYVVSIRTSKPTAYFGDNHFCTGTLITSSIVITAAHCVVDGLSIVTRPKRLRVVAGSPFRLKKEPTTMEFEVDRVLPHGHFKRSHGGDIALLILANPIPKAHAHIKILSLAVRKVDVGTGCYTLGWGQLFWDGPYADHVTYGNLSIIHREECVRFYGKTFTDDLLCVQNPRDPYVDTCRGDSGAPLICNGKLAGVVAFSSMCNDMNPTAFTNVTRYIDWITKSPQEQCKPALSHLFLILVLFGIVK